MEMRGHQRTNSMGKSISVEVEAVIKERYAKLRERKIPQHTAIRYIKAVHQFVDAGLETSDLPPGLPFVSVEDKINALEIAVAVAILRQCCGSGYGSHAGTRLVRSWRGAGATP
jgi:hypothetical protein